VAELCHCDECDSRELAVDEDTGEELTCDYCDRPLYEGQKRVCSRDCARALESDRA
jgi:hypothetical protein